MFSLLLLCALHRIRLRQQVNATLNEAILRLEVDTTMFHLQVDDIVDREPGAGLPQAVAMIDAALVSADVMQKRGGDPVPLSGVEALGLRQRAAEMKSLLLAFKAHGVQRVRERENAGKGSPSDRRFDLAFNEILKKGAVIEAICLANRLSAQRANDKLTPVLYLIWGFFTIGATAGIWVVEMRRLAAESSLWEANARLRSQAEELFAHREQLEKSVERRTAELTASNAALRNEVAERLLAEETLRGSELRIRQLSLRLLKAQEIERKRISMELHDELGQALNVMKLRITGIQGGLHPEQETARQECEGLLEYLDEEIEEVRRLSLALSPTALEELGLAPALRWLIGNFTRVHPVKVSSEVADIDDLFPEGHWITVYRVLQEALANVGRHALASEVTVSALHREDRVDFLVADDGRGFDPEEARGRAPAEKGVGLFTMGERVRMLGGSFHLSSRQGEGTRVAFSLPVSSGRD